MRKFLSIFVWTMSVYTVSAHEIYHPDIYDEDILSPAENYYTNNTNEKKMEPATNNPQLRLVNDYIDAINKGDINTLNRLMADDYLFIDAHDNRVHGKEGMEKSWIGYFEMFPDYRIEIDQIIEKGSTFCLLGYASGTYKNLKNEQNTNYWRVPAAWTIIIENNQVKHWQVYADNYFAIEIISRNTTR